MQNDIDSDYSKYKIEDRSLLFSFSSKKRGFVSYDDNNKEKFINFETIGRGENKP